MSRALIGTKELGLVTEWRFGFAGFGQHAVSTPGVVYLDTGQEIAPGVLDHHAGAGEFDCTAELVAARREDVYNHLLGDVLRRHLGGESVKGIRWTPTIVTHRSPDWDGVVSAHLVIRLLEDGDFPEYTDALVQYTREIDQGRYRLDKDHIETLTAPHLAYLALQNLRLSPDDQMRRGLELIERVVGHVMEARAAAHAGRLSRGSHFHPGEPGATRWLDDASLADLRDLLMGDRERFERDWKLGRRFDVLLPSREGELVTVPAFVAPQPMESMLDKYWVRAAGCPLFVCPSGPTGGPAFRRVVISVDPNWESGGLHPSLRGLGYALEQVEKEHRERRNGGMDDRGGAPRFRGGYCDNDDPWYDGRDFNYTIVDAPNTSTCIPYDRIVAIATEHFWEVPVRSGTVYLVWNRMGNAVPAGGHGHAVPEPEGSAPTLHSFYKHCSERRADVPLQEDLPCISVSTSIREFPKGLGRADGSSETLSPALAVVELTAEPGCSMEALIEARKKVVKAVGEGPPDYLLARVVPGTHFAGPGRVETLVRELADADAGPAGELAGGEEVLLFNGRILVLRNPARGRPFCSAPRVDREILLYAAFLNEALAGFSRKIAGLLVGAGGTVENVRAEGVCRDFLIFQTRYYQPEVCRAPRGRLLMERLAASLGLPENYAEVRSELDRLEQFERQLAEDRENRSDRVLQWTLFFVAVSGIYQTVLAYLAADSTIRHSASFWLTALAIATLAAGLFYRSRGHRKRVRSQPHEGSE